MTTRSTRPLHSCSSTRPTSGNAVWNDQGALYAFVSNIPAVNDYGDLSTALPSVPGHFIEVPRAIATGKINGREVTSADFGYPRPTDADPFPSQQTLAMPDGPQWVLEHWSNLNNVFQFIRIEDLAYDRTNGKTVYFADTGEPRAIPDARTTRLRRGGSTTRGAHPNGRLYRLVMNSSDPLGTATLSILPGANFDDLGYNNAASPHQPDNIESTANAIYFQEDPGSHNAQPLFPAATNARVWRYGLTTGMTRVVAEVDQSHEPGHEQGHVGVERHRGRVSRVRPRCVPRGRPGAPVGHGRRRGERSHRPCPSASAGSSS